MAFEKLTYRAAGAFALICSFAFLTFLLHIDDADWLSRSRSPESYERAIQAVPEDWELYEGLAETSPSEALSALRQAAKLNPQYSGIRIELASRAETAHQFSEAETNLLAATSLDRTSIPAIQLAEFYFRQRDTEHFWATVRSALMRSKTLPTALLQDCWKLTANSDMILEKVIPERPRAEIEYLQFLLDENHIEAARPIALKIMQRPSERSKLDAPVLSEIMTRYCDKLVSQNSIFAVDVWNWQIANKLITYEELSQSSGRWVTNSEFKRVPISAGFDWRLENVDGLSVDHSPLRNAVRLSFSGKQPEHCEILSQYIPLWPGRRYRFQAYYDVYTISSVSGLQWRIILPSGAMAPTYTVGNTASADVAPGDQSFGFVGTDKPAIGRLVMSYDRTPGTVKIEGEMQIRSVVASLE